MSARLTTGVGFVMAVMLCCAMAGQTNVAEIMKSAKQGDAVAQRTLGAMYADGKGVETNHTEAAKWFRK